MYAGTIIEYVDLSEIPEQTSTDTSDPFYIAAFSSEKGTEEPIVVSGMDFYKMFVTPDNTQPTGYFVPFAKHGQPLLQAANIIDNGGKLYAKRVVADDATLANITVFANVTSEEYQETVNGIPQYYSMTDAGEYVMSNGARVKVSAAVNANGYPNEAVMVTGAGIRYTFATETAAKTIRDVAAANGAKSTTYSYTAADGMVAGIYAFADAEGIMHEFIVDTDIAAGEVITWAEGATEVMVAGTAIETEAVETSDATVISMTATKTFPILTITDNGRGESKKKVRLVPNYDYSKDLDYMVYNLHVIEENRTLLNTLVSLDADAIYLNRNIAIDNQFTLPTAQIKTKFNNAAYTDMIAEVAAILGKDVETVKGYDILNGTDRKGNILTDINVINSLDPAVDVDLQNVYGVQLQGGSNGAFGNNPLETEEYTNQLVKFFSGQYTDDIYDVDNLKFDFVVDANYPMAVKKAIEDFVMFREDTFFICDFGLNVQNIADVENMVSEVREDSRKADSKFVAYYHTYYDIEDPYTHKPITVTIAYDLAALLVAHCANGRIRPLAGQLYGITFPNAIEGTVNFIPKIIPGVNQKQMMNDIRVNYATYYDGVLTLDSEYTSQKKHTQFSYINNVLATQEVVKAIRTRCPKIRYSFLSQEGLTNYKQDVQDNVLSQYASNFEQLELVYLGDSTYEANKIFYAGINVKFRDFVQTEIFKVYALL